MDKRRLCIYVTYDKQNIIDDYIGYMLKELKTCVDCLTVVCNGLDVVKGADILEKYADFLFFRENIGLDAGAFKDALCNLLGWDKVMEYDELFLVNDSFFGPFRPMADIVQEMEGKEADFWGLSKHGEGMDENKEHFPEHIQSFFLAFRSRILHSTAFRGYWERLPFFATWKEVVRIFEIPFTDHFVRQGYNYAVLADNDINNSSVLENNYTHYMMLPYELIVRRNFPFLKKKPLETNRLDIQTQEGFRRALDYIDKDTTYDVGYIYDNIIRTMNIADLYRKLHLRYISPRHISCNKHGKKIFIAVFVEFREPVEYILEYLGNLQDRDISIGIYGKEEGILEDYRKVGYGCRAIQPDGSYPGLVQEISASDYVCIIHDVDISSEKELNCIGKSYLHSVWENLAKDVGHVGYIISCFEDEPWLGLLAPPDPMFSYYFGRAGSEWRQMFCRVSQAVEELRLQCQLSGSKPPIAVTDSFWIRGSVLEAFLQKGYGEVSILRFLWSYIAQDAGYYSGVVETAEYAAMDGVNSQYYLGTIASKVTMQYGKFEDFAGLQKLIFRGAVQEYCRKYPHLFIYGTGYIARKYKEMLPEFQAYIVSDGQQKPDSVDGKEVVYLSDIEVTEDTGIVVCMDEKNQAQVIPALENMGIKHYLCV